MPTLPAIFLGHGNPMNAIARNATTDAWASIGASIPKPRSILAVSAHWYGPGTRVTAMEAPPTIHDFGGFPQALFDVSYPAPGDPALARRVAELLAPVAVDLDIMDWGLDHGTWSVLCHLYKEADVPVVQLSIDAMRPPQFHYDMGRALGPLRDEGVLVIGSGNVVHNLRAYAWGRQGAAPLDWAVRFDTTVRKLALAVNDAALVAYDRLGRDAANAIPTPEHYLPLLYVLGTRRPGDAVTFPVAGIDGGSVSMLAVRLG
ncbi:MAG TPA: 4,5-DOPA dioxygenase extradiol [Blastocatellia bacterium]|nr:4,5-DOPA dioxygenase extradiol [Blastocatellia bacterium]